MSEINADIAPHLKYRQGKEHPKAERQTQAQGMSIKERQRIIKNREKNQRAPREGLRTIARRNLGKIGLVLGLGVAAGGVAAVATGAIDLGSQKHEIYASTQTPDQTIRNNDKIFAGIEEESGTRPVISPNTLRIRLSGMDLHTGTPHITGNPDEGATIPGVNITSIDGVPVDPNTEDVLISQAIIRPDGENTTGNGMTAPWVSVEITTNTNPNEQLAYFAFTHETEVTGNVNIVPHSNIGEISYTGNSSETFAGSTTAGIGISFDQVSRTSTIPMNAPETH